MTEPFDSSGWEAVDDYVEDRLLGSDEALEQALAANAAAALPAIDVSAPQGKMLHILAKLGGARQILEIGTLGGYSTIWLARALPADGQLVSLEIDERHAEVARQNVAGAGLADKVDIRAGPALDTLSAMRRAGEGPFDLVFIDADKQNNSNYVREALAMARPGTLIVVDNVVREGRVVQTDNPDAAIKGIRALFDMVGADTRLTATAVQTVGSKGWDGFLLAIVD